jgi:hypothetical protein
MRGMAREPSKTRRNNRHLGTTRQFLVRSLAVTNKPERKVQLPLRGRPWPSLRVTRWLVLNWVQHRNLNVFSSRYALQRISELEMLWDASAATFIAVLTALVVLGVKLGSYAGPDTNHLLAFLLIFAACIWCGAGCYSAYKHFADEFARATWHDFLSYQRRSTPAKE